VPELPELPDLTVYQEAPETCSYDAVLENIRLGSPFVLGSVAPPIEDDRGRKVLGWRRIAKQLVCTLEDDRFVVIHLMVVERLSQGETETWHRACIERLGAWSERLRKEAGDRFPKKVTALRREITVHGKYRES